MAKIDPSQLHNFVNGETVYEDSLDQNFEVLRVGINDTDARVDNTYTKAEVDLKINQATTTKNVAVGNEFPPPPNTDGEEFFRLDLGALFVFQATYNNPDPAFGHWKKIGEVTPASKTALGGIVVGDHFSVDANGKLSLLPATTGRIGGVRPSSNRFTVAGDGTLDIVMGLGSGLDADRVHNIDGKFVAWAARFFRHLMSGADGAKIVTSFETFPSHVMAYSNLTINSGQMFYHPAMTDDSQKGPIFIGVSGTLTLNGTISVGAAGARGGESVLSGCAAGGKGGGIIIILANQIAGTGTIEASGEDGENSTNAAPSTVADGIAGYTGKVLGSVIPGAPASKGNDSASLVGGARNIVAANMIDAFLSGLVSVQGDDIGGGGGGSAPTRYSYGTDGANGGAGVGGSGGAGADINTASSSNKGAPGGGGGGGGLIILISPNPVPAIKLNAKGGKAGNAAGYAGGSGGGGGGMVVVYAPSSSATISVTGGAGGLGAGGGTTGKAGSAGISRLITM